MKYVSASEARKRWFELVDEAAEGEEIGIQRDAKRLVLKLAEEKQEIPRYGRLLRADDPDQADTWRWDWDASEGLKADDD